ncbi:PHRF1 [Branchiostoma lanceolatum]|uniref:PHRF1 protein n=1 Tax=Branchiostoma lanceolatum TaxID=7740 RepID=A0A8J9ZLJ4_BRALA|nr:PHRF1 [Branchiostoma lanceolatum]
MGKKTQTQTSPVTAAAGNSPPTMPGGDGPNMASLSPPSPHGRKHRNRRQERHDVAQQEQNMSTRQKASSTVVKEEKTGLSELDTSANGTGMSSTDHGATGRSGSGKRKKTGSGEHGQGDTGEKNTAVGKQHVHKTRQKTSEKEVRTDVHQPTSPGAQGHGRGKKRKDPPSTPGRRNNDEANKSVNGTSGSRSRPSPKKRCHSRGSAPGGRSSAVGASCSSVKLESGAATQDSVATTGSRSKENKKKKGGTGKEKEPSLETSPGKGDRTADKVTGGAAGTSSSSDKRQKRKKGRKKESQAELGTDGATAAKTETTEPAEVEKCAICLEELTDQAVGTPACCQHSYCLGCIQTWAQRKNKCPVDNRTFHEIVARERLGGAITNRIPAPDRNEVHPEDEDDLFTINIDGEEVNILEQLNGYFLRNQEEWDGWDDDDDGWVTFDEDADDSDDDDEDEDDSDEDSDTDGDDTSEEEDDNSDIEDCSLNGSEGDWDTFYADQSDSYPDSDGSDDGGSPDSGSEDYSDSNDSSGREDDDDAGPNDHYNDGDSYTEEESEEGSGYDDDDQGENPDNYNNEYGDDGYDGYNNGYDDNYGGYSHGYDDGYYDGYNDQSNNDDNYDDGYGNDYSDSHDQDSDADSDSGSDW